MPAVPHLTGVASRIDYLQSQHGWIAEPAQRSGALAWTSDWLDLVIQAIESFPSGTLASIRAEKKLNVHLMPEGRDNVLANATVALYPLLSKEPQNVRYDVLIHELGHVVGSLFGADISKEWSQIAENESERVTPYAHTNALEDFAETVLYYRNKPEKMRVGSDRYDYMREIVFDGIEYQTESQCTSPARISEQLERKLITQLEERAGEFKRVCSSQISNERYYRGCLETQIRLATRKLAPEVIRDHAFRYPNAALRSYLRRLEVSEQSRIQALQFKVISDIN